VGPGVARKYLRHVRAMQRYECACVLRAGNNRIKYCIISVFVLRRRILACSLRRARAYILMTEHTHLTYSYNTLFIGDTYI
jgi:hypothetical protein